MKTRLLQASLCLLFTSSLHAQYWSLNGNSGTTLKNGIGTTTNVSVRIITNNQERIKVTGIGNVGIGVSGPQHKLHVGGNAAINGNVVIGGSSISGNDKLFVEGSTLINGPLAVNGLISASTSFQDAYGLRILSTGSGSYGIYGEGISYGIHGHSNSGVGIAGTSNGRGAGVTGNGYYGVVGDGRWGVKGSGEYGVVGETEIEMGNAFHGRADAVDAWGAQFYSVQSLGLYAATYNPESAAATFSGSVHADAYYTSSDKRLKQNIADVGSSLDLIGKLKPKTYEFRQDLAVPQPKGKHYGLIAQEVEEVLPELVKQSNYKLKYPDSVKGRVMDYKAINYMELIPILVGAVQQQQEQIEELKQKVAHLENERASGASLNNYKLGEVSPNPVKGTALVRYSIPEGTARAQLLLTDAMGRQLKTFQLTSSGTVSIDTGVLASGVYHYSLIVDKQAVATKKMTVVK